jgi:hypothetical protein
MHSEGADENQASWLQAWNPSKYFHGIDKFN